MSGLNKSFLEKSASAPGNGLFSKPAFLKTFLLFTFLIILFSLSVSNSGAETSFLINKSNVLVNTTYKEGVSLSPGYPVITDRSGVTEYSSSTIQPQQWTSVNGSINFLTTANNLPIGNYTFTIKVYDRANNSREDSKNFTILYRLSGCGDRIVNVSAGEECDDGNLVNNDGCNNQCKIVVCGNSKVESGEECDGANLNGMECPFGGSLNCYSNNCSYDVRSCASPPSFCGDGRIQPGEQCDGSSQSIACTALNPTYTGGTARCVAAKCIYDTSSCTGGATSGFCGDSIIERPNSAGFNEQCDSSTYGKDCSDINPVFIGGSLSCTNCFYNTTQCTVGEGSYCGDDAKNRLDEECDKTDLGSQTCKSLGYVSGDLVCSTNCKLDKSDCVAGSGSYCGDGAVQVPNSAGFNEQCDLTSMNSKTCSSFPPYTSGTLGCKGDCSFDYARCAGNSPRCGDSVRNQLSESCDGNDLLGQTCKALGYASGDLSCYSSSNLNACQLDKSDCVSANSSSKVCGDAIIQKPNDANLNEVCDGTNLNSKKCFDFDNYKNGTLSCSGDCSFDYANCKKPTNVSQGICGDGILNSGTEVCDKFDWGLVKACSTFNSFVNGTLRCSADCHFNTSGCIVGIQNSTCSNKKKDGVESDVDCGGYCLCCPSAKSCVINNDCCSGFCRSGICAEPRCDDKVLNGLETDIDCGGSCPKCNDTSSCNVDDDCASGFCNLQNKCSTPNCNDDEKNGLETDKDCGGSCPAKCKIGMACFSGIDCESGYCDAGICSCDQSKDTDADGMPDCWELNYGLDPNDPDDADKDYDGDRKTNLEEYRAGTDPTKSDELGRKKSNTLAIILLILGVLLMGGSAAFLIYSRKVLLPEQRKKASAARSAGAQFQSRQPSQSSFNKLSGQPAGSSARLTQNISLAGVLARRKQASANNNPSQSASQLSAQSAAKQSQSSSSDKKMLGSDSKQDRNEFIPISELGKKQQPGGKESSAKPIFASDKKEDRPSSLGDSFEKLKSLVQKSVRGDVGSGSDSNVTANADKNQSTSQKDVKQALKELSDSVKDKTKTNKDEKAKK